MPLMVGPSKRCVQGRWCQVTAAIFGLLGVIVGGVLNGLVSAWLAARALRSDRQVSIRLVQSELAFFLGAATRAASVPLEDLPTLHRATTELWQNNRSVLAKSLDDTQWVLVARAYAYIDALLALLVFGPDGKLAQWRIEEGTRSCKEMIKPIKVALKVLSGDGQDQSVDYKYHPRQEPRPSEEPRPNEEPSENEDEELIQKWGGLPPDAIPR